MELDLFTYEWETIKAVIQDRILPRYNLLTQQTLCPRWQSVLREMQLDDLRMIATTLERIDPATIAEDSGKVDQIFKNAIFSTVTSLDNLYPRKPTV